MPIVLKKPGVTMAMSQWGRSGGAARRSSMSNDTDISSPWSGSGKPNAADRTPGTALIRSRSRSENAI